jgi:uncharacterized membrane protein YdbT with pleckstrin-like domain
METFIASRLTSGNRIFRSKITIDEHGVTLNDPALFKRKEQTIPFDRISAVKIVCPFVGFSAISIETTGEGKIISQGFTSYKVKRMKKLILNKI